MLSIKNSMLQKPGKYSSRSTAMEIACKTNEIAPLLFSTLWRPQLEYNIQFWVMHTQKDMSQLKKVQSRENDQ